jgi:superfamily II DNA/RNA helicase
MSESNEPADSAPESDSQPDAATDPSPASEPAEPPKPPVVPWEELGLFESTLAQIRAAGWTAPTPIQAGVIPHAVTGRDVIGAAQTGTGKTGAFMIPIIEQLALADGEMPRPAGGPSALILAPTRELAAQIAETARLFTPGTGLGSALVVGGVPMDAQYYALDGTAQILIATPGRICDHLMRGSLRLDKIEILVLDEADRMLDMGFEIQLERIVGVCPKERQTMLFSATMPPGVEKMSSAALHDPMRIEVARPGIAAKRIEQQFIECNGGEKDDILVDILRGFHVRRPDLIPKFLDAVLPAAELMLAPEKLEAFRKFGGDTLTA